MFYLEAKDSKNSATCRLDSYIARLDFINNIYFYLSCIFQAYEKLHHYGDERYHSVHCFGARLCHRFCQVLGRYKSEYLPICNELRSEKFGSVIWQYWVRTINYSVIIAVIWTEFGQRHEVDLLGSINFGKKNLPL